MKKELMTGIAGFIIGALVVGIATMGSAPADTQGKMRNTMQFHSAEKSVKDRLDDARFGSKDEIGMEIVLEQENGGGNAQTVSKEYCDTYDPAGEIADCYATHEAGAMSDQQLAGCIERVEKRGELCEQMGY